MKLRRCCVGGTGERTASSPSASPWLRGRTVGKMLVSGVAFMLVPKCPACLAAYIALVSGIGISMTAAVYLRSSMLLLSASAILFLALQALCRFCFRKPA